MDATAAVTTGRGVAAIASIQLAGESARAIIEEIFKPHSTKKAYIEPSAVLVGNIIDQSYGNGIYLYNIHNSLISDNIINIPAGRPYFNEQGGSSNNLKTDNFLSTY